LTVYLKGIVEDALPAVWVAGEISNLSRPRSGHLYMTLKDDRAQLRAVMWRSTAERLKFDLKDGQQVLAYGGIEVYPPQGSYQLNMRKIVPQGIGDLQLAFQQLQQRLQAEGLFDPARKMKIPSFPRRIGVVTSPSGAAIRDFLEIALRRWPQLDITVIPAKVQGPGAAQTIVAGIRDAHRITPPLDVLVVTRGGGSMEDLWCFNEEPVVRAIAASRIPIVSAVGHEIDVTLADFAADVRALTPSEAAERIVPDYVAVRDALQKLSTRLHRPIFQRIRYHKEQLRQLSQRSAFRRPHSTIHEFRQRLDELDARARRAIRQRWTTESRRLESSTVALAALSPLQVLARGYTVTRHLETGKCLTSADQVKAGDQLQTQTLDGIVISEVQNASSKNT
jgi:exodeoxyribonuclease VII large subunit